MYKKSQLNSVTNSETWIDTASYDEMIQMQVLLISYNAPVWLNISPVLSPDAGGHGHPPEHDTCVEKVDPAAHSSLTAPFGVLMSNNANIIIALETLNTFLRRIRVWMTMDKTQVFNTA